MRGGLRGQGPVLDCRHLSAPGVAGPATDIAEGPRREPVARAGDSRLDGELSAKVVKAERIVPFST